MVINQLAKVAENLGGAFSGERLQYALEMTVLGLAAVFAVLAIIWAILALFKVFAYDIPNRKKGNAGNAVQKEDVNAVLQAVPVVETKPIASVNNDDITVAIITAAISAYIASDKNLAQEY